jgi:uncharacterized 2Fe-2S/4Fe-4S cluster protein (DUF4445 family)
VRLACQIVPRTSLDVTVLSPASPSNWRAPVLAHYRPAYPVPVAATNRSDGRSEPRFGVAVDLGTTHVTIGLCDLATGRRLAARTGLNPQAGICSDVIGRLHRAADSPQNRRQMQSLAEGAIHDALFDLLRGEGLASASIVRLRVVGNAAMLTLLRGADPRPLLDPKRWCDRRDGEGEGEGKRDAEGEGRRLIERLDLAPAADVGLVPALGGFVGSDLVLGLVHTRLLDLPPPSLLIDFGTNSEIGLWDGQRVWVTAVAGGPAFEGGGIGCGMVGESGAVHRLVRSSEGVWRGVSFEGEPIRGICGSGLIDLLAHLVKAGEIDERGRPVSRPLEIDLGERRFSISKSDIDVLQRAKAATAAGLATLAGRAGISLRAIRSVHVAGAFGLHLDLENAIAVGLLPDLPIDRFHLAGNTALSGALDIMVSPQSQRMLLLARERTKLVNLSMDPDFDDLFVENLFLRPITGRG